MPAATIEAVTVADAVANELRRRLLAGEYAQGQEMRDTELAAEFGAARPTVRAAVQTLVAEGLLHRGHGRSARVRGFTIDDAVDLYRVRRAIEPVAVRMIIEGELPLRGVQESIDAFRGLGRRATWASAADHDVAFHRAVMQTAGSPRLVRAFDDVSVETRLLIGQLQPAYEQIGELVREHLDLLFALQASRIRPALALWHKHLDDGEQMMRRLVTERDR